jgi:putative MATE family efflux protein
MPPAEPIPPRFVTGSTMRHVLVMATTGAIGLVAVFAVDLLNLFYISRLGERPIAAAVGFAGVVGFLQTSVSIGLMIGLGAVVSRTIGAGRMDDARRIATGSMIVMAGLMLLLGLLTVALLGPLLSALGARGETAALARQFLTITSPSLPLLSAGMGLSGLLRCVGDARRAMNVTLVAAFVTAGIDPIMIFALHLGLTGAAISTVISRCVLLGMGWYGAMHVHRLLGRFRPQALAADLRAVFAVSGPAVLTNLATPVGATYVTHSMALFGTAAVAGQATIDRISPVAFGLVYAMSGAVGPILAQNMGAGRADRVRTTLRDSLIFAAIAVLGAWAILAAAQGFVVAAFSAEGETAVLIRLFCSWLAAAFLFTGALFVANAAFNNLGFPLLSTLFNWGRATLGTIPFVTIGAGYGPAGVLFGQAAGSVVFGIAAAIVAFRVVGRLGDGAAHAGAHPLVAGSGQAALALATTARPDADGVSAAATVSGAPASALRRAF